MRNIEQQDIPVLHSLIYENSEWKQFDAPYFPLEPKDIAAYEAEMTEKYINSDSDEPASRLVIEADGEIIGTVSYYWEHRESNWLEMGIVIYTPAYWSHGYGTEALTLWIDHLFQQMPLMRVGLTTWSGNPRMIRSAEKLGMTMEGRMRKCRYYNGEYYDSIRMGILREEWESRSRV
nr:GNAT family protein [Cohnella lubricantis]